ncbi:MAG TPA: hypothetical protein VNJ08_14525 [Bacteriovoracaceae bacterium]|nr:hypothetical protein [Bacteriovoracaceae bacterium]
MSNDVLVSVDTEEKLPLWAAHVEVGQVQFLQSPDLGIDFYNHIDAWRKMEVSFKHRIDRPNVKRCRKDLLTLHYSFRQKF